MARISKHQASKRTKKGWETRRKNLKKNQHLKRYGKNALRGAATGAMVNYGRGANIHREHTLLIAHGVKSIPPKDGKAVYGLSGAILGAGIGVGATAASDITKAAGRHRGIQQIRKNQRKPKR